MSETQVENKQKTETQIEVKKKVFLMIHRDDFKEENLEPIIIVNGDKIHIIFLKRKYNGDIYYVFNNRNYLKIWLDKKGNILTYIDNWADELFINNPQKTEYIDYISFTTTENGLICTDIDGKRKKLVLEGFDILSLTINQFSRYEKAIFYIICNKLS